MTQHDEPIAAPPLTTPTPTPVGVFPLAIWLFLQLAAFAWASSQVELATGSSGYPRPAERMAPSFVTAVQIGAAALVFPALLRPWRNAILAIGAVWPFQLAAAAIVGTEFRLAVVVSGYVTAWLVGLALLAVTIKNRTVELAIGGLMALVAWGGGAAWYLAAEFGPPLSSTATSTSTHFGPLAEGIDLCRTGRLGDHWGFISLFLAAVIAIAAAQHLFFRKRGGSLSV
jgi:hypothetical protein